MSSPDRGFPYGRPLDAQTQGSAVWVGCAGGAQLLADALASCRAELAVQALARMPAAARACLRDLPVGLRCHERCGRRTLHCARAIRRHALQRSMDTCQLEVA